MKQKKIYVCSFVKLCVDVDMHVIGYKLLCRKCFVTDNGEFVTRTLAKLRESNTELLTCETVIHHEEVDNATYAVKHLQDTIESANKELKWYLGKKLHSLIDKTLDKLYARKKL